MSPILDRKIAIFFFSFSFQDFILSFALYRVVHLILRPARFLGQGISSGDHPKDDIDLGQENTSLAYASTWVMQRDADTNTWGRYKIDHNFQISGHGYHIEPFHSLT